MSVTARMMITAKVVADSVNAQGDRLTSLELHYPRFIHAEFLRHRMFSHSVSSSRAIPVKKMINQINENPATPIYWGKNQPGMSAACEVDDIESAEKAWEMSVRSAVINAKLFDSMEVHKQITNRIVEPFQFINQVVTATDFDNFFYLRIDKHAQPEICALAEEMYKAMEESEPVLTSSYLGGSEEYHMPYIEESQKDKYSVLECQKISASMCAQSSYRLADSSLEKAEMIYDKLVNSRPLHASPFEHIATPFTEQEYDMRLKYKDTFKRALMSFGQEEHYAEAKSNMIMYEGNFCGWSQMRKHLKDETCWNYNHD